MYFFFRLQAIVLLLAVSSQAGGSPTRASADYIAGLIRESVSSHPSIEAAKARTDAATSAIRAVRLWEDPQLGLGTMAAGTAMRMDDGDIRVGVDQILPRKGLFRAEKRLATAEQQVQESTRQQSEVELGLTVGQTVVELALADELIRLQSENLEWLKTIVEIAAERSKSPDGSASESLRLESELALRTQALASLKRTR
ncbi:MAG TPA: TolC family protein, partial [Verrucomicrobiales bacterium]|nr:TolC family protein [Verrucomicrobiales bacterium]